MNIIELANQAKGEPAWNGMEWHWEELEAFAALVAAHEREECAKVCEKPGWNAANWCAKAIRERGEA